MALRIFCHLLTSRSYDDSNDKIISYQHVVIGIEKERLCRAMCGFSNKKKMNEKKKHLPRLYTRNHLNFFSSSTRLTIE